MGKWQTAIACKKAKVKYFTTTDLAFRGWTKRQIQEFLKSPDSTTPNPVYSSGAPVKLYDKSRVARIEKSKRFLADQQASDLRRKASTKAIETRRAALNKWVDELAIRVPSMEAPELIDKACDSYNILHAESGLHATSSANRDFLDRICVNFLRHAMTDYEALLESTFGKVGVKEANIAIKEKILDAIAEAYPNLAGECRRQDEANQERAIDL